MIIKNNIHMTKLIYIYLDVKKLIGRYPTAAVTYTACKDEFRRNLRSHSWSVFSYFFIKF